MKRLLAVLMVMCLAAGAAMVCAADDTAGQTTDEQKAVQPPAPPTRGHHGMDGMKSRQAMRGRGPAALDAVPGQPQEFAKKQHDQMIGELEAIRKIAREEKATKTVEAIQQLIDKKNNDFKTRQAEMEKRRTEMMERIRQRQQAQPQDQATGTQDQPSPKSKIKDKADKKTK